MTHTREITQVEMERFNKYFSDANVKPDCIVVTGNEFLPKREYFGVAGFGNEAETSCGANFLRRYGDGNFDAKNERFGCQETNMIELLPVGLYSFERESGLGLATSSHAQFNYKV